MTRIEVPTYTAQIYLGGPISDAMRTARAFCDRVGLCVTVEPVSYLYTGGSTDGVRVGLINYGRFPAEPEIIFATAEELALLLIPAMGQESASIVATDRTVWISFRPSGEDSPANSQNQEHRS